MKTFSLFCSLLISSLVAPMPASASPAPNSLSLRILPQSIAAKPSRSQTRNIGEAATAPVLRDAKFKIKIKKKTFKKQPGGDFDFEETEVCTASGILKVYDVRGPNKVIGSEAFEKLLCPTTFKGETANVRFGGFLAIGDTELIDGTATIKGLFAYLTLSTASNPWSSDHPALSANIASQDLQAPSFIAWLEPLVSSYCEAEPPTPMPSTANSGTLLTDSTTSESKCKANMDESFSALIEVEDK